MDAGCEFTGERHLLESHLRLQCRYIQVPCLCSDKSCKRTVARKDTLDGRTVVHQESDPEVRHCSRFPSQGGLTFVYLLQSDNTRNTTCESCGKEFSDASAVKGHLANSCPEKIVPCDQAGNGCSWRGQKLSLKAHVEKCPYESIKGFFAIHNADVTQLSKDNERLRRRTEELEGVVRILKQELEWTKVALGPWYRPVYTERPPLTTNYAQYPNDEGASLGPGPGRIGQMLLRGVDPMTGGTSHPVQNGAAEGFDFIDPFSFVGQTRNHNPNIHITNNTSTTRIVTSTEPDRSARTSSNAVESGNSDDHNGDTISGTGSSGARFSNGPETTRNTTASVLSPGTSIQSTSSTPSTTLFSDHFPSENQVALEGSGSSSWPQDLQHALPPNPMLSNPTSGMHSPVSISVLATHLLQSLT
jgi:hypothetical protein